MTIDGVAFVDVQVTGTVTVKQNDTIQWTVRNQSSVNLTNVGVVDFAPGNGGTAFSAGPPPPIPNLPAKVAGAPTPKVLYPATPIPADGDPDTYKYSVVANGLLVKDPEMVLDP
jgi:hypothetical protein